MWFWYVILVSTIVDAKPGVEHADYGPHLVAHCSSCKYIVNHKHLQTTGSEQNLNISAVSQHSLVFASPAFNSICKQHCNSFLQTLWCMVLLPTVTGCSKIQCFLRSCGPWNFVIDYTHLNFTIQLLFKHKNRWNHFAFIKPVNCASVSLPLVGFCGTKQWIAWEHAV